MSFRRNGWLWSLSLALIFGCAPGTDGYRTFSDSDDEPPPAASDAAAPVIPARTTTENGLVDAAAAPAKTTPTAPHVPVEPDANRAAESPPSSVPPGLPRPPPVPETIPVAMLDRGDEAVLDAPPDQPSQPREPKLLVPEKDFQRVEPNRSLRVSYDDLDLLKVLNMEPVPVDCVDYFPDWLKALDGAQIRIRGFMLPPLRETGLPRFQLARDNQICCFGRDPKVYDLIPVQLKDGVTTDYIPNRPFDVVGRFYIRPDAFRGNLQNLYEIEDAEIIAR